MVHAAVQEGPVVGHQKKALLSAEIAAHHLSSVGIQVIGGLIDEREASFPKEEQGQQKLGLLPVGKGVIGAVEDLFLQLQPGHLPQETPALQSRLQLLQRIPGQPLRVDGFTGKVFKAHRGRDAAPVFVLPQQQAQKGGLAPAVAAGEAQLPVGVELKAHVLEDLVVAAVVSKRKMRNVDQ